MPSIPESYQLKPSFEKDSDSPPPPLSPKYQTCKPPAKHPLEEEKRTKVVWRSRGQGTFCSVVKGSKGLFGAANGSRGKFCDPKNLYPGRRSISTAHTVKSGA